MKNTFLKGLTLVVATIGLASCTGKNNSSTSTALQSISIQDSAAVYVGESLTLTVTYNPAETKDLLVVWSSDNPCAKVDQNGTVTGYSVGVAKIKVMSYSNYKIYCNV